ncbi:unnamed protein product, partial [marine sediment metagenome]
NLLFGNGTDYVDAGGDAGVTSAKNVTQDSTSPDGATYQDWDPDDPATPTCFSNYAGDDFTLDETEATLDDGDDLSGIGAPAEFSDDVEGNSRSTWYIGASEFAAAADIGTAALDTITLSQLAETITLDETGTGALDTVTLSQLAPGLAIPAGSYVYGHDTAVDEDYLRNLAQGTFSSAWYEGAGDAEKILLAAGGTWISKVEYVGAGNMVINTDTYDTGSGSVTVHYKTGTTIANCIADSWNAYSDGFTSTGWAQVKITGA